MNKNVGSRDRAVRVGAAVLIAVLLVTHVLQGTWAVIGAVVALALVVTSLVGYCPAYSLVGANTCKKG